MNCVENLPVYGALVLVIVASGARGPWLDTLALVFLSARLLQTVTHVGFRLTDLTVTVRFGFFLVQLLCMVWMGGLVASVGKNSSRPSSGSDPGMVGFQLLRG